MASFPIPEENTHHRMSSITCGLQNLGAVVSDLIPSHSQFRLNEAQTIHLDPYLRCISSEVPRGWLPSFGQESSAQSHLKRQGVGPGDLFLFFGWFRRVQRDGKTARWKYAPDAPDLHVLFGWLQIGAVLKVSDHRHWRDQYEWLDDHPHIQQPKPYASNNTIYIASSHLNIGGRSIKSLENTVAGGGVFDTFSEKQRLTYVGQQDQPVRRSLWKLPKWFMTADESGIHLLTYHRNPSRWRKIPNECEGVALQSVPKGQEFVLDLERVSSPEITPWLEGLFS